MCRVHGTARGGDGLVREAEGTKKGSRIRSKTLCVCSVTVRLDVSGLARLPVRFRVNCHIVGLGNCMDTIPQILRKRNTGKCRWTTACSPAASTDMYG